MATQKYRFIPFAYMQEVATQLASETPTRIEVTTQQAGETLTRIEEFTYAYDLPDLAKEVHQIVWKEVASITVYLYTNLAYRLARPTISRIGRRRRKRPSRISQFHDSFGSTQRQPACGRTKVLPVLWCRFLTALYRFQFMI